MAPRAARFQIGRAVGRRQRGCIGDVHPQPPAQEIPLSVQPALDQRDGVVGILVVPVIDGVGRQVGQVQPVLLRAVRVGRCSG